MSSKQSEFPELSPNESLHQIRCSYCDSKLEIKIVDLNDPNLVKKLPKPPEWDGGSPRSLHVAEFEGMKLEVFPSLHDREPVFHARIYSLWNNPFPSFSFSFYNQDVDSAKKLTELVALGLAVSKCES